VGELAANYRCPLGEVALVGLALELELGVVHTLPPVHACPSTGVALTTITSLRNGMRS